MNELNMLLLCFRGKMFGRNLPLAISIGIPFTTAIYVLAFVSYLTILAPIEIINSEAVANEWATRLLFLSAENQ